MGALNAPQMFRRQSIHVIMLQIAIPLFTIFSEIFVGLAFFLGVGAIWRLGA